MSDDYIRDRIRERLDAMPETLHVPTVYAARSLNARSLDPLGSLLDVFAALARENVELMKLAQKYAALAPPAPIVLQGVDLVSEPCVCGKCHGPAVLRGRIGAPCVVAATATTSPTT